MTKFDVSLLIKSKCKTPDEMLSTSSTTKYEYIFTHKNATRTRPPTAASALNPASGVAVLWQYMQFLISI